jgi:hypothetical protein
MSAGKPRRSWLDNAAKYQKKMDVSGRRKIARDRDTWKLILTKDKVLHVS